MTNKLKLLLPLSYLNYRNRLGLKKLVVTRESTIQKKCLLFHNPLNP